MQPANALASSTNAEKMQALKQMGADHIQTKVLVIDDQDKRIWELIKNVPLVNKPVAVMQAIFNLIFPGVGTMIMACS